ncbi:MAG: DUF2007 domain-containing protein [Rudaea sp.]|uniref:DUF2007 domain-containing protein n=1 Tax=marine sediment metagenome TaxID=412755 RepID=X1GYU2_9ZZZZ|nr:MULTISPECIES: DUF2007 domain-containing protein [unclassified Rudaea]MBN8887709.1 DUF2007 domain-containing protein [Rudaea sp.]MBR0343991.1 DUF2007 domain-containing protein [Rudaea sp.]
MRQIYTSARNENVDRVVALLRDAGIETSVTNRSNYAGHDYKGPSYATKPNREGWAQVWVVHSEDQARARAMLREIGIEPPTRYAEELEQSRNKERTPTERRSRFVWNIRTVLLIAIGLLLMLNWLGIIKIF